jgi:D-amino-acid dehydrogenase
MTRGTGRAVAVIGGGIVGMATALTLQLDGHRVTLFDPREPGSGTSYGNAGGIVDNGFVPTSTPGLWKRVPRMLADPDGPLTMRWRHLPRMMPWLSAFLLSGTAARATGIAAEMATLTTGAVAAHRALLRAAGDPDILRPVGWLKIYRDEAALAGTAFDRALLDRFGLPYEVLDEDELRRLEPGLSRDYARAIFYPGSAFVSTPFALTQAYLRAFLDRGGQLVREEARRFETGAAGLTKLVTDRGIHAVDQVVIAAGARSALLTAPLGQPLPLDCERGYHLNLSWGGADPVLGRPVVVGGPQFVLCPMADGLRLTGGVEFAGLDAPPDFRRIQRMVALARRVLPGLGGEITREWMGLRPSFPDSKPVIGRSSRHPNLWFAFGHGHLGLTLSAVTGRMIADAMAGRPAAIPLAPFRDSRFRGFLAPAGTD